MPIHKKLLATPFAAVLSLAALHAEEPVDLEMVNRIRDEGFHRSQVVETLRHLADRIGPRLTGSPQLREANVWTRDQLAAWGLENARLHRWGPFGRGWSFSRSSVHMISPRALPLSALPRAWTPGTDGPVRGEALRFEIEKPEQLEEHRGKVAGKVLFLDEPREIADATSGDFRRYDEAELDALTEFDIPDEPSDEWLQRRRKRTQLNEALNDFAVEEGVVATVVISSRDNGVVRVGGGGSRELGENPGVPSIAMAAESYNWILRLLDEEETVELEIDIAARFHDEDLDGYNTIAEIPGSDPAGEVVMLGAHLDSWHAGTGSNDNAAGCAVVMEAVRILKALGIQPKRTIRVALWTGEEQGLHGSRAYVEEHFATRPEPEDPEELELPRRLRKRTWPIQPLPDHAKLAAYFNLDNGSGKIRGIYTQENTAARPIFEAWLEPFHDLGADTVTNRNTGGTDHLPFDWVGLPGFQFIQDGLNYSTRTHHSNLDVFDHARRDDLIQASVVMASFVYHAAMRDERFPREPIPQKPKEKPRKKEPESDGPEA